MLRAFAAGFALALASPALAEEAPTWRAVDASTGQIRDVEGLEQLARDFPDSGTVRLRMLQPLLEAHEVEKVMETLEWLYDRGYVFSDVVKEQIPKLLEGVDPGRIAERLIAEALVIETSRLEANVPVIAGLAKSVIKIDGVFGVTSISENALILNNGDGSWSKIDLASHNDLSGFVFDARSGIGWIASGNVDGSEEHEEAFD